jgi:CubicO group peptidase (beta-lactamase class C family)
MEWHIVVKNLAAPWSWRPRWPRWIIRCGLVLLSTALVGCGHTDPRGVLAVASPPAATGDGWEVSSLAAEGLDGARLTALERSLVEGQYQPPDALVVARNGKLVYEQYWNGFGPDTLHDLRSATKSITSLLVGIAIDRGHLPGVDARALPFFPEYQDLVRGDERKGRITLADLLTMSPGLACDDWNPASPGQEDKMYRSRDWLRFLLGVPMLHAPGEVTAYCTGGVVLLGGVVARAAGKAIPDFSREALFAPLGITRFAWKATPSGGTDTGGHLRLRARDLAKVGQLLLDEGRWHGTEVVSSSWVAASTAPHVHLGDSEYGYLWWRNTFRVSGTPFEAIFARGNGGQYLFVFPALRMVAVFVGNHYNSPIGDQAIEMCARFLLTAAGGLNSRP